MRRPVARRREFRLQPHQPQGVQAVHYGGADAAEIVSADLACREARKVRSEANHTWLAPLSLQADWG